jgi:membrane protein DedA with SNARE-associated domain
MRRVLQFLLFVSSATAAAALWELGRTWIGYSIGEAFNSSGLIRSPENFEAEHALRVWGSYFLIAICLILTLTVTYRKNYRGGSKGV